MNDLISRQALCEYALNQKDKSVTPNDIMRFPSAEPEEFEWCTDCKEYDQNKHCCHRWTKVIRQTVEELKQAQPEQRWIPCSEETGDGYPEEDGFYYVTEQNYGFYLDADCKQRVTHTSHFKNGDFTDRFYTENNSNITAWMPLPEPYKGE